MGKRMHNNGRLRKLVEIGKLGSIEFSEKRNQLLSVLNLLASEQSGRSFIVFFDLSNISAL